MSAARAAHLSRRGLLAAGGALGVGALLTACGNDNGGGSSDGGEWSFTDDRKEKASADGVPERIVAFTGTAAVLHDLGLQDKVVGIFGDATLGNGKPTPAAGDFDIKKAEIIGNEHGEFSMEKYAGLRPELLVSHYFDGTMFYVPEESKEKILKLAPSASIDCGHVSITQPIERYVDLAKSLGADPKAKRVTDAKARFEKASEELRKTAASSKIKVLAASCTSDTFYVSNPEENADLIYFRELGVDLVVPDNPDEGGDYFESLSWENTDKYAADVILLDDRTVSLQPADMKDEPGWRKLPAVKADQLSTWQAIPRYSWAGMVPALERLTRVLQDSKKVR